MRISRNLIWLLLVLALAAVTMAVSSTESRSRFPRVTVHYESQELPIVLKDVAKQMGVTVWLGPSVAGTVSLDARNEDWEFVLAKFLRDSEYDFQVVESRNLGLCLVVGARSRIQEICDDVREDRGCGFRRGDFPKDGIRAEFLLEEELAAKVIDFLANEYPRVRFDPHPFLNGFFATGSREELELIREEVKRINNFPASPYLLP